MNAAGDVKLSVIIPTKNRPHLLKRALSSVAQQDYPYFEICVVDNNIDTQISADVEATVKQFEKDYPQFKWICIHSRKPFASGARNDGLAATTGSYIAFLDDDDELMPRSLTLRAGEMEHDADLALLYCAAWSKIYPYPINMYRYYKYNKQRHKEHLLMMSCSSIMINRRIFEQHNLYFDEEQSRMDDYDLCRRVIQLDLKVKSMPQPLVQIHLHPETRISSHQLESYDFKNVLVLRWGKSAEDVVYDYAEGVHLWRKCFGTQELSYPQVLSSLRNDFKREATRSFRIKYAMITFSPVLYLAAYHVAIFLSQLYKNNRW